MATTQAVIDLGFGDNGKGTFTSYLCSIANNPLVIRFTGGPQSGHTSKTNGLEHTHSSFGSGTILNVPTYWNSNCLFSPLLFNNEWEVLKEKNIEPEFYIHGKCPIITPFDMGYNKKMDKISRHGSCGYGIGATRAREESFYSLLVEDLKFPSVFKEKTKLIAEKYYKNVVLHSQAMLDIFFFDCFEALNRINIVYSTPEEYNTRIYEGSQGLLLDPTIGFFPHVTRGNTGLNSMWVGEVFYVTRAYQVRHGNGPMTNEDIDHNIKINPNETNITNEYQGAFRRSVLDIDLLQYALIKDKSEWATKKSLVITCLDHIEGEFRYTYKGELFTSNDESTFIKRISNLLGIHSVYISKSDKFENITKWS